MYKKQISLDPYKIADDLDRASALREAINNYCLNNKLLDVISDFKISMTEEGQLFIDYNYLPKRNICILLEILKNVCPKGIKLHINGLHLLDKDYDRLSAYMLDHTSQFSEFTIIPRVNIHE